jgi:hypothetical protein
MITKLYCYVDETGQDTKGELFLVAVLLKESSKLETLQKKLEKTERRTGKRQLKWKKTNRDTKKKYLEEFSTQNTKPQRNTRS